MSKKKKEDGDNMSSAVSIPTSGYSTLTMPMASNSIWVTAGAASNATGNVITYGGATYGGNVGNTFTTLPTNITTTPYGSTMPLTVPSMSFGYYNMTEALDSIDGKKPLATVYVSTDGKILTVILDKDFLGNGEDVKKIKSNNFIYKNLYFIDETEEYANQKRYRFVYKTKIQIESLEHKLEDLLKDGEEVVVSKDMNGNLKIKEEAEAIEYLTEDEKDAREDRQTWGLRLNDD